MKDKTKPCECGTAKMHIGQGVYICYTCGHCWDTWNWCAPRGGWNEELAELVRQAAGESEDDEDE